MATPDPTRQTPAEPTSKPNDGATSNQPLIVAVSCERTKGGAAYILAKEKRNAGSGGPARWTVQDTCNVTLESVEAIRGGTISGQRRTGNGKHIHARYEIDGDGPLVYALCVETKSGSRLAYGGPPAGKVEEIPCVELAIRVPEPPPKIRI